MTSRSADQHILIREFLEVVGKTRESFYHGKVSSNSLSAASIRSSGVSRTERYNDRRSTKFSPARISGSYDQASTVIVLASLGFAGFKSRDA